MKNNTCVHILTRGEDIDAVFAKRESAEDYLRMTLKYVYGLNPIDAFYIEYGNGTLKKIDGVAMLPENIDRTIDEAPFKGLHRLAALREQEETPLEWRILAKHLADEKKGG